MQPIDWGEWFAANPHAGEQGGPNRGPVVQLFLRGDVGLPWCSAYIVVCLLLAGFKLPYWANRNVRAFESWCEVHGKRLAPADSPQRGDVVFFHNRDGSDTGAGGHVGFVAQVLNGTIVTLEGNLSDGYGSRTFAARDARISSYARF